MDLKALRGNLEKNLRGRGKAGKTDNAQKASAAPPHAANDEPAGQNAPPHAQKGEIILASYNIHKCVGTDKIFNPQRIIDVIADLNADILALQEVDKRFGARQGLLDLAALEERTGLRPAPLRSPAPQGQGWRGNALFFRAGAVTSVEQIALPGVEPRGALIAEFAFQAGGRLRIIAAHFGLLRRSRSLQAEAILALLKNKQPLPTVLLGDLNEWRLGKKSSLKALAPIFTATAELPPSFPARFPLLSLDRVFFTPQNLVGSVTVHDTPLARIASDHLPIKAGLHLQSQTAAEKQWEEAANAAAPL